MHSGFGAIVTATRSRAHWYTWGVMGNEGLGFVKEGYCDHGAMNLALIYAF